MSSVAIITGIGGQDGRYLAELLLQKGYRVHGVIRPGGASAQAIAEGIKNSNSADIIDSHSPRLQIHAIDLLNQNQLRALIEETQPKEYYNLAAMSCVPKSWDAPIGCVETNSLATAHALEIIRLVDPSIRFCQAGSSEMFGRPITSPQSELTPFRPRNPYASSKVMSHHLTCNFREQYRLFACNTILFNHESPRRSLDFVSRKITTAVARIKLGLQTELRMGNLEAERDWGFAGDYVEAMWLAMQQDKPDDFVIGTGIARKVADMVQFAFACAELDPEKHVFVDPAFHRPEHGCKLVADPSKANRALDWQPKISFQEMLKMMVAADIERTEQQLAEPLKKSLDRLAA
ncbi:MAG: GDP-mannose 4,6-dehydratase [Planctomycetota bacterium]|jgi:GDPmannose 4,6-dehydratase